MSPEQALAALTRAAVSLQQLPVGPARQCSKIVSEALAQGDMSSQLNSLKAELAERTIRIAELEEELAEAKKPKRRATKKKIAE